jgi:DNA repair protein RecN (Recombination protein N)
LDAAAAPLLSLQEEAVARLRELQGELGRYLDKLELDQETTQRLEQRMNLLQSLKRKYGATLADVITFGEEAKQKLELLEGRDAELRRLNEQLGELENQIMRAGLELTARRRKIAPKLTGAVEKELAQLGFLRSHFDIALSSAGLDTIAHEQANSRKPALSGFDTLEFHFAPNPGEPARALRAIASSGELARVMLALKTVLAEVDQVPVLIFDEVDANVGGETANALGKKMLRISRNRQVLCITHLPQVAAPASAHFVVSKTLRKGRTESRIELLNAEDRVSELARMLGGQGQAARKHAEELLQR